jgi:hypothetical protein
MLFFNTTKYKDKNKPTFDKSVSFPRWREVLRGDTRLSPPLIRSYERENFSFLQF